MNIDKNIQNVIINVTPAKKRIGEIVGFAELQLTDENDIVLFKVRGYTIRVKTFKERPTFVVSAPAYKSGFNYKQSFIVEDKEFWYKVSKAIISEFSELTGGLNPGDFMSEVHVDPDDIPF